MVPRSRDSQIGCCLLPEAAPHKQQLVGTNISRVRGVFPTIKHKFCILYFVFVFCFHDLGIPKLVVVIPKAAPHKQQLVVTNISWATGVFQTKYRSVLNKFKKSQNSYYSVLFGELVPKPVIISKLSRKRGFEQVPSPETIHIVTVNYNTWEQLGSQIELGVGATVTLADRWLTKLS